ncbi:DUF885 domain-containing protein [Nocardia shimofusensis]|uniref:DUF885 domain-containing protein n=1 Tax=Nocardia shimofusensis TaxID=228596 RepID=UPI000A89407D|nr:DUF885 domain-containing protein [Nocardia shimofusensis]
MDRELWRLAEHYWDTVLEFAPTTATMLGDHRFDDRIEDVSVEAEQRTMQAWRRIQQQVVAIDASRLDPADHLARDLLLADIARAVTELEWRPVEMSAGQMGGVHARLLTSLSQITAPHAIAAEALAQRHRQIGALLDEAARRFRDGLGVGRAPARVTIERSINQIDSYLASELSADPFVTVTGPEGWMGEPAWRNELAEIAQEVVRPAFHRYRDMLATELLPYSRPGERAGLCWLGDDGAEIYHRLIRCHTTMLGLDADDIHRIGSAELDRLREEYARVGHRQFGTTDTELIFARLRQDPDLRYRDGAEILARTRRYFDAAAAAAADWFGRLPTHPCEIVAVPDYLAADSPAAYYYPPAADGSSPGTYYVNLHNAEGQARYETAAVVFHEAVPGHHLQLALAAESTDLPRFQRQSWANTAFVEGWALYAERLAHEMGLYDDDLDLLGMLAGDSLRSCRLVVDTGLHAKGWSRQQAIDFMSAHTPNSIEEITVEVDRYIDIPGQALGYKLGQLEIQRQRARASERLGRRFDLRAFHDAVLAAGALTLPTLAAIADTL